MKQDIVAAWQVLESLAVSLHRIGSAFGTEKGHPPDVARRQAMLEALDAYFSPELQRSINDARQRLGRHLSEEEAEELSEQVISYWSKSQQRRR